MIDVNNLLMGGVVLAIGFAVAFGVYIFKRVLLSKIKSGLIYSVVKPLAMPLIVYIVVTTIYTACWMYFKEYIAFDAMYYSAVCVLVGTWAAYRAVLSAIDFMMPATKENSKKVAPLSKFLARLLILVIGLFMILSVLKIDITPLLASAGVAGKCIRRGGAVY